MPRKRCSACWIYYNLSTCFFVFFFFLTVIFSVNNSSDAGSSPWSRAWGAWPLCLQFCWHFSCSLCRSCGNSLKCTNTYFSSPQNSVFHTIIVESMSTFTLRFYFSEVHNYKNLLQIQLSIHNCKYRCFQPIKTLGSLLFMPDVPLYLWCGLTAAQDTEHSSPVSICGCSKNWKGNSHCWKLGFPLEMKMHTTVCVVGRRCTVSLLP